MRWLSPYRQIFACLSLYYSIKKLQRENIQKFGEKMPQQILYSAKIEIRNVENIFFAN